MRADAAALITAVVAATGSTDPEVVFTEATRLLPAAYRIEHFIDLTGDAELDGFQGRCVRFVEPILKVSKVVRGDGAKCRVWYADGPRETAQGFEDPGYLETDWLGRDLPDRVVQIALASVGKRCLFYKRNRTDPDGAVTQGFRTLVWLQPFADTVAKQAEVADRIIDRPDDPEQLHRGKLVDREAGVEGVVEARKELADAARADVEDAVEAHQEITEERAAREADRRPPADREYPLDEEPF